MKFGQDVAHLTGSGRLRANGRRSGWAIMGPMQTLRNAHILARLVLVWFALFIGVSVASPLVKPQTSQMVCSATGMQMVVSDDGAGNGAQPLATMDCPLCAPVAAPPGMGIEVSAQGGLSYALQSMEQARLATLIGPPWQARAPPLSLLITSAA